MTRRTLEEVNPYGLTDDEYKAYLGEEYKMVIFTEDGRWYGLSRMIFTVALLAGHVDDRSGYYDRWCYDDVTMAALHYGMWTAHKFEGEPEGWIRHPGTGRRRPNGRKDLEFVEA